MIKGKMINKKIISILLCSCLLFTLATVTTVSAAAPDKPDRPTGPNDGQPDTPLQFETSTMDDDHDPIYYKWRIRRTIPGDSFVWETDWMGPYNYPDYTCVWTYTFEDHGRYTLYAQAIDDPNGDGDVSDGTESAWSPNKNLWISELPLPPTIEGPAQGVPWELITFTFTPNDDTWLQQLQVDWGLGDFDEDYWSYNEIYDNGPIQKSYMYLEEGEFTIRARTREVWYTGMGHTPYFISDWAYFTIEIMERPPETPELDGPTFTFAGQPVTFSAVSEDMDDSNIQYMFDWGNGEDSYWIPKDGVPAGETCEASYTYDTAGTYNVRVKAKDDVGESDWSEPIELTVHSLRLMGIGGGFNPSFTIQNSGPVSKDVEWSVEFIGGIPGFHLNKQFEGSLESVKPDTTATVELPMVFGLGDFDMAITLDIAGEEPYTQTYDVFILFFYMR